jgi:hypothetical protein
MPLIQITNIQKNEVINIEEVREHLAMLLLSPSFDPYSNHIVAQAITLLSVLIKCYLTKTVKNGPTMKNKCSKPTNNNANYDYAQ